MRKNIKLLGTTFITVLILLVSMLSLTACGSSQQYTYKSMECNFTKSRNQNDKR